MLSSSTKELIPTHHKYVFKKKLISKTQFYFKKSARTLALNSLYQILFLLLFFFGFGYFLINPLFDKTAFILFEIFLFIIFFILIYKLKYLFKLLQGGVWEIAIIDSKLIWNRPNQIGESFTIELSNVSAVICEQLKKDEYNNSYTYRIRTIEGEEIELEHNLGIDFKLLAPLIGKVEDIGVR